MPAQAGLLHSVWVVVPPTIDSYQTGVQGTHYFQKVTENMVTMALGNCREEIGRKSCPHFKMCPLMSDSSLFTSPTVRSIKEKRKERGLKAPTLVTISD